MNLQQKLTSVMILDASWMSWLLLGFTIGGAPLLLQRAFHLVTTAWRRRAETRRRRRRDGGRARGVEVTTPGFAIC